jgi:LysM repeat protein
MPRHKPNQFARFAAVGSLIGAIVLIAVTVSSSGGGSDDDGDDGGGNNGAVERSEPTQRGERALDKGIYRVKEGDTLAQIAQDTGVELDTLLELNPKLDPQALSPGQRVRLR